MKIGDGAVRNSGGAGQVTITINSPDGGFSFTGSQKFTIEFWMRHNVFSSVDVGALNFTNNTNTPNRIQIKGSGTAAGSSYTFFNASTTSQNTTNIVADTYSHVALVCHGDDTFDGYVGGTRRVTNASFFTGSTKTFLIGNSHDAPGGTGGWVIDELRVSNNERYTGSSYTPSTTAFTTDANTIALFHFDQDALYTDSAYTD